MINKFTEEKVDKNNTTEGSEISRETSSGEVKKKVGLSVTSDINEIFVIDKY